MATTQPTAAAVVAHSPGEWRVLDDTYLWAISPDTRLRDDQMIARFMYCGPRIERRDGDYEFPETEANLRLCAAAPEMLAALRESLRVHLEIAYSGDCGNWDPEEMPVVIQARAAIAKATGAQP